MIRSRMQFFATTSLGLEAVLSEELKALGARNITIGRGGVSFEGDEIHIYKTNLWLRTATRVLVTLRTFSAVHEVMLYDQIKRMKWEQYLTPEKTLSVDCTMGGVSRPKDTENMGERAGARFGDKSSERSRESGRDRNRGRDRDEYYQPKIPKKGLTHSHYVSLKIKDAIVDRCREKYGARPNVDTEKPDLKIHAYIVGTKCTLSLDSTSRSLHERGYRKQTGEAPIKETLAAALVKMSEWDGKLPFYDPMCGSGTFAIEAALIAQNVAPGLLRYDGYFGFKGFPEYDEKLWKQLCDEARAQVNQKQQARIYSFDQNPYRLQQAKENASRAGVERIIHFEKKEFVDSEPPCKDAGVLLMNPPYGERMGDPEKLEGLYKSLGDTLKHHYKNWNAFIFTGNLESLKWVGLRTSRRIHLHNGPIECRLLKYQMY